MAAMNFDVAYDAYNYGVNCVVCGEICSGLGSCKQCGGDLCFLCAVFLKKEKKSTCVEQGSVPYCESCSKEVLDKTA